MLVEIIVGKDHCLWVAGAVLHLYSHGLCLGSRQLARNGMMDRMTSERLKYRGNGVEERGLLVRDDVFD